MGGQIFQRLWDACALQVGRRCHYHQFAIFQQAGNQRRVRLGAHADGQVVPFGDKVDIAVADVDIHRDLRVQRAKPGQQRQQAVMGVGGGNADTQQARRHGLRAHHFLLRLHQLGQGLAALLEEGPTTVGETNAAGGAHKQA